MTKLPPAVICVTGNMASGKTTLAELLARSLPEACCVYEPHLENPFLPLYLKDKARWGFTAQLRYFYDYTRVYHAAIASETYRYHVVDTGIWTNRLVYAAYLRDEGIMTADEYEFYLTLCGTIQAAQAMQEPHAAIFVQASPRTCWDRMQRRGWGYQVQAVEMEYMEALDRRFAAMQQTLAAGGTPTLTLSSEALDFASEAGRADTLALVEGFLGLHKLAHP